MATIEPDRTLAELVLERPGLARTFEELQIDYCCGGGQTLDEAAARRGLDPRTLAAALEAAVGAGSGCGEGDWRERPLGELCDHIVDVHHAFLRSELPRIGELLAKVAKRHGEKRPELRQLEAEFANLREDLIEHIDREEDGVFALCRSLGEDGEEVSPIVFRQLTMHEAAHQSVGEELSTIRSLSGGYRTEDALCTSHRVLLEALAELERDLHQHIHEENNVLFPLLRETLGEAQAPAAAGGG